MYSKRIRIFIIVVSFLFVVSFGRLAHLQLVNSSRYRQEIAQLKLQRGSYTQLKTIRGEILDRKGVVLAVDEPKFYLCISYKLCSVLDKRVLRAKLLRAAQKNDSRQAVTEVEQQIKDGLEDIEQIIEKCQHFGLQKAQLETRLQKINDKIWNRRTFLAWRRKYLDQQILKKYDNKIARIPASVALADFKKKEPVEDKRILLAAAVDIPDMHKSKPLLELETDDDIFTAQLEFADVEGISIVPESNRSYPLGSVAAQTIGWVGPEHKKELFADDKLLSYLEGDISGKEDGIEYVCETILRGRRGELIYDIDDELVGETKTRFGKDVELTLDIGLQEKIENMLQSCELNSNCEKPTAAVVIDVATGDILVLASLPGYDLNRGRYDYADLRSDHNRPLLNRAINKLYPPGSVIKPLILIAGMESGKIGTNDTISCPAQKPPKGWPRCWIQKKYSWKGHDDDWANIGRNALKGSCNIYFSRLANRIGPGVLQRWFFEFGCGRKILAGPAALEATAYERNLRQFAGCISTIIPQKKVSAFGDLPPIEKRERRYFGIGQGNLRVTPLQVANIMATIARGGLYKQPCLFSGENGLSKSLNISAETLNVVRDGIGAVVNEPGGTAYSVFSKFDFNEQAVKVYGKTGSTEAPDNAWFAGFAEDKKGRSIAVAVLIEEGQHGSSDAGPLAAQIIQFCIDAGYIGKSPPRTI